MVDYESRGPRGGYNRKRRYRDDDDYDRRQQRRRYEEPLAVTVRKQLATIAESAVRRAEDDVVRIAKTMSEHYDDEDEEVKNTFVSLVLQLVGEQPFKIPFVAATVLTANTMKPELAAEVLKKAGEIAQSHIEAGNWRNVKLMLRFLACLQGLFEGEGIFPVLEELFSRAVDLQTASSEDSLGLELVKIILFTIPYVMSSSASGFETQAAALLEKTDIIASTPHTLEALVDPFPSDEVKEEKRMSVIGLLQKQLQEEGKQGWELTCIPRPWTGLMSTTKPEGMPEGNEEKAGETKEEKEEKEPEDPLKNATKHVFPTITVPNPVPNGPKSIFPDVYFSVYFDQDLETVPPTTDIAASLLRDSLTDTIDMLDFNRIATAKFLIDVDCYFAPKTFIKRATPFDKIRDAVAAGTADRSTWKPEDVAVDAVFSLLFQLPTPQHKLVYYHSVLTEACKIAPAAIAPSLGRAIRYLYKNVERMDLTLSYRFLDWFAHHLSNFGFTWKWTEWVDDVELPAVHPKKAFICGALDKEIRLSFAQRIKGTLPEPYQALISEGKEKDTPEFKYALETTPFATEAQEIMQLIRKKAPETEIEPHILAIQHAAASQPDIADPLIPSTDAFVTSICYVGSKSLSHVLSCIERSKERLLAIGPKSPAARRQIITSVLSYWADQPGIGVNIIDKLLNYTILTPLSVVEWALVDHIDGGAALAKAHVYEMVAATMGKVTNRIRQIVAARVQAGIVEPQLSVIDETLRRERGDVQVMFEVIEGALEGVINGSNESGSGSGSGMEDVGEGVVEEKGLIREWARRWLRVFKRLRAVEEAFIAEAMARAVPVGTMPPVQQQPAETGAEPVTTEGAADNVDMADI
ncbi:cap binding protein, variant 2 [Blastomyces gilchristii SLH14081]|uniref:Cap binding protein n=1 Tax=Blastomyces gilchristii (strain SLH14081) TaxID=559298 RepID=A0A179V4R3_BLAGS|nr:cap binding protein [Blastomyces gilchristii SLH14081]XP_031581389.1 cap binding protein, variant 1 [Blastomyces gilchristii SLH14081]XP_031581390.1 cap binding protein, variant 2 [Blastomyces gilchristii SLH14081]OAT14359.1 cap binding protein [Blastomyces gilchristii SLH14081]OAT14360.1 cap binding protein, variant 1 [Blastomyces gilchristii SLH14081]OAT14361.1 cap binding protein, variant 2 [Blastomyces gilchristii SLH14081]